MKPGFLRLWWWQRRMRRVHKGMSPADVQTRMGEPSGKLNHGELEIWSYDLERLADNQYSIRVAFADQRVCQTYIGMELCR